MKLVLKPVEPIFDYHVLFQETIFDWLKEDSRISLLKKFIKAFDLKLNEINLNTEKLSGNYLYFSKYLYPGLFNVSLGMEEVSAKLRNPLDEKEIMKIFGQLFNIIENNPIYLQRMTLQQQNIAEGDAISFMKSLNSDIPNNFKDIVAGMGVNYDFNISEHNFKSHITVANSIFIEGGIYIYFQIEFSPNLYGFQDAFNIAMEHYNFILDELRLIIKREA